jgi:sugar phosphate isomerase/epimerase
MELAANTYSLRALPRAAAFARLDALDLRAVELWAGHAGHLHGGDSPRAVRREATDAGLTIRAYCIGGLFGLPLSSVEARFARALEFAHGLGTDLVTTIVDRAAVPAVDRLAGGAGMRVGLENHWYTQLARPADYARVLPGCSPAIGIAIDTGHFAFLGLDLAAVARALGPSTVHVHLKVVVPEGRLARIRRRWRRQYRMPAARPGPADGLDAFLPALAAAGYRGLLAIEHEADGAADAVAAGIAHYRARVAEILPDGGPRIDEAADG